MKIIIRDYIIKNLVFWCCFCTSAGLLIGGFLLPPVGIIDGSVLKGVGELLGYSTLWVAYISIMKGINASVRKGDMEVTVATDDSE